MKLKKKILAPIIFLMLVVLMASSCGKENVNPFQKRSKQMSRDSNQMIICG